MITPLVVVFLFFIASSIQSTSATFEAKYIARIRNQLSSAKSVVLSFQTSDHGEDSSMEDAASEEVIVIKHGRSIEWKSEIETSIPPVQYVFVWHEKGFEKVQNQVSLLNPTDIPVECYLDSDKTCLEEYVLSSSPSLSEEDDNQANCLVNLKNKLPNGKPVFLSIHAMNSKQEVDHHSEGRVLKFIGSIEHGGTLSLSVTVNLHRDEDCEYVCFWNVKNDDSIKGTLHLFQHKDIPINYFSDRKIYVYTVNVVLDKISKV